jgi:ribosomal protein S27AE
MKELFRERDYTRVGYYQTILEAEGIPTFVRNENTVTFMTEVPIPEFYPALCVVNDEDFDRALEVLKSYVKDDEQLSQKNTTCPKCGETNPANFEVCWSCSAPLR